LNAIDVHLANFACLFDSDQSTPIRNAVQQYLHGLTGGKATSVRNIARSAVESLATRAAEASSEQDRVDLLCAAGFALHLYGDSHSHSGLGGQEDPSDLLYATGYGHAARGIKPDCILYSSSEFPNAKRRELWADYLLSIPQLLGADLRPEREQVVQDFLEHLKQLPPDDSQRNYYGDVRIPFAQIVNTPSFLRNAFANEDKYYCDVFISTAWPRSTVAPHCKRAWEEFRHVVAAEFDQVPEARSASTDWAYADPVFGGTGWCIVKALLDVGFSLVVPDPPPPPPPPTGVPHDLTPRTSPSSGSTPPTAPVTPPTAVPPDLTPRTSPSSGSTPPTAPVTPPTAVPPDLTPRTSPTSGSTPPTAAPPDLTPRTSPTSGSTPPTAAPPDLTPRTSPTSGRTPPTIVATPSMGVTPRTATPDGRAAPIYFDTAKASLSRKGCATLSEFWLQRTPKSFAKIVVVGHADHRDDDIYNLCLGFRRGWRVAAQLRAWNRDREDEILVISCGERRPRRTGNTARALAENRRVELLEDEAVAARWRLDDKCESTPPANCRIDPDDTGCE
jgi:outer membrane protein OmpA-like peptidoglycan-associated protein